MEETIIKSQTLKLEEISGNSDFNKFLNIPRYQRPYSWTKKEVEDLLKDIIKSKRDSYYIGTIYLMENEYFDLLDGQQRMTTLFLILLALDNKNKLNKELKRFYRKNNKWRVNFSNKDFLSKIDEISKVDKLKTTEKNYFNSYKIIKKFIAGLDDKHLNSFVVKLQNIYITFIKIDKKSNPYVIFNSLNNRGISLNMGDIIKNFLLSSSKDIDPDILNSQWRQLGKEIDKLKINNNKFYEKILKDYYMVEFGMTKSKAIEHIENQFNTFKDPNKDDLNAAKKLIDTYIDFVVNIRKAYDQEENLSVFFKTKKYITQKERIENLWRHAFKDKKFLQIKPLAHKLIQFLTKEEDQNKLIKSIYMIFLIKKYFEESNAKANIFEKDIKKKVYKDKTFDQLNKRLAKFIIKNDKLEALFDIIYTKPRWADKNNKYKRKELIYMSTLFKKNIKSSINDLNFEHTNGRNNDIERFFVLEEAINSELGKIENPSLDLRIKYYKKSKLLFPKTIKSFEKIHEEEKGQNLRIIKQDIKIMANKKIV